MPAERRSATVSVFGSGAAEPGSAEYERSCRLGAVLARAGFRLCNGGYGGTMAAAAQAAREAGGSTVGVVLAGRRRQAPNPWLDEIVVKEDLLSRIACLLHLADGYVILAGGTGTLAELGVLLEMLGKRHMPAKPTALLGSFWAPLVQLLKDEAVFRRRGDFHAVDGVRMIGDVAQTESPEAAGRFLSANIL